MVNKEDKLESIVDREKPLGFGAGVSVGIVAGVLMNLFSSTFQYDIRFWEKIQSGYSNASRFEVAGHDKDKNGEIEAYLEDWRSGESYALREGANGKPVLLDYEVESARAPKVIFLNKEEVK